MAELDPAARKTLEVALHTGSAGTLALLAWRTRAWTRRAATVEVRPVDATGDSAAERGAEGRRATAARLAHEAGLLALTFAPAAVVGLMLERPIERRLGGVRSVAGAQIGAGVALWLADRRPGTRGEPDLRDHLAVGLGQALALVPGVSRAGAALTVGRAVGLERQAAVRLSFRAALPVTLGATALKGVRALRGELAPELRLPLASGALAALVTGVASSGLAAWLERSRSLAPVAAYRIALGSVALARTRDRT